jgi:hypothetical protein
VIRERESLCGVEGSLPSFPRSALGIDASVHETHPKKNAAGASHPDRIVRGFPDSPRPPLTQRDDASGPTALPRECRICQSWLHSRSCDHTAQPLRGTGSPFPLMSGIGEEAATPGQPARVRTRLRNVPRRFTLENHRLLQALPQSSGKPRKLSRFRCSHSPSQPRPPQHKKSPRLCRNCGRKAFLVETRGKPGTVTNARGCPVLVSASFAETERGI